MLRKLSLTIHLSIRATRNTPLRPASTPRYYLDFALHLLRQIADITYNTTEACDNSEVEPASHRLLT